MSASKCPKCENTSFKLVTQEPADSRYKYSFIQCSRCETPVGVVDFFNTGAQLDGVSQQLNLVHSRLASIENTQEQILRAMKNF